MSSNFNDLLEKVAAAKQKAKEEVEAVETASNQNEEEVEIEEVPTQTTKVVTNVIELETISLKEIAKTFTRFAPTLLQAIDEGLETPLEVYADLKQFSNTCEYYLENTKEKAINYIQNRGIRNEELKEYKLEMATSGDTLDYEKDAEYREIKAKLKEREEALKNAFKFKDISVFYTEDGEVVPIVPIKSYGRPYLKSTKK